VSGERARDLDDAPLGDRQSMHEPIGPDGAEAELIEERAGPLAHGGIIDDAKPRTGLQRQIGDGNILGDGHVWHDRYFLRQQPNARGDGGARVPEADLLAVDADLACIAGVDAGQDFHQRRLACAIGAEERENLAGGYGQIDIRQHDDPAERFADAAHFKTRPRRSRSGRHRCDCLCVFALSLSKSRE
jgi:hypothetical protein